MITDDCAYCRSTRHGRLAGIEHERGCPASGRRLMRMSTADIELFAHPDLMTLDLEMAAWYPQTG